MPTSPLRASRGTSVSLAASFDVSTSWPSESRKRVRGADELAPRTRCSCSPPASSSAIDSKLSSRRSQSSRLALSAPRARRSATVKQPREAGEVGGLEHVLGERLERRLALHGPGVYGHLGVLV